MSVEIPRVDCPYPMYIDIGNGERPIRMRDDLDPYQPPAEYADGRVSWAGYGSREERDRAQVAERAAEVVSREAEARQQLRRDIDRLEARRSSLQQAVATCPGHRPESTSDSRGFTAPVAEAREGSEYNPAAHGNLQVTETCRCGAKRYTLINGCHEEYSGWTKHYVEIDDELTRLRAARDGSRRGVR